MVARVVGVGVVVTGDSVGVLAFAFNVSTSGATASSPLESSAYTTTLMAVS